MSKDWISKAVNPKHKGYCTPMTKATCTPKRKALARTFKKHHGFHKAEDGLQVYNPNLAAADKPFMKWYAKNTLEGQNNIPFSESLDYDYYSFFKNNAKGNIKDHFPDTYKRPTHPTFSDESVYSVPENTGGHWEGDVFIPKKMLVGGYANNPYGTPFVNNFDPNYNNGFNPYATNYNTNPNFQNIPAVNQPLYNGDIDTGKSLAYDATDKQVNRGNFQAKMAMVDPLSMGLDAGGAAMDATANLMASLGKDGSKAQAFGQGAGNAMKVAGQITAPFSKIPVVGKALDAVGKTAGFIIGGALNARKQAIENEELEKADKLREFYDRNQQVVSAPSYYGNYMAKKGINMEQKMIDDILSSYDKYMKLT